MINNCKINVNNDNSLMIARYLDCLSFLKTKDGEKLTLAGRDEGFNFYFSTISTTVSSCESKRVKGKLSQVVVPGTLKFKNL